LGGPETDDESQEEEISEIRKRSKKPSKAGSGDLEDEEALAIRLLQGT